MFQTVAYAYLVISPFAISWLLRQDKNSHIWDMWWPWCFVVFALRCPTCGDLGISTEELSELNVKATPACKIPYTRVLSFFWLLLLFSTFHCFYFFTPCSFNKSREILNSPEALVSDHANFQIKVQNPVVYNIPQTIPANVNTPLPPKTYNAHTEALLFIKVHPWAF